MKMEILKYLTTNAFSKINNLLKSPSERGQILEPLCCLYRLSLLPFYNDGVKISIYENKICIKKFLEVNYSFCWQENEEYCKTFDRNVFDLQSFKVPRM